MNYNAGRRSPLQPLEEPRDESPCQSDRWCLDSHGFPSDCKAGSTVEDAMVVTDEGPLDYAEQMVDDCDAELLDHVGLTAASTVMAAEFGECPVGPLASSDKTIDACDGLTAPNTGEVHIAAAKSSPSQPSMPQPPGARAETVGVEQLWNSQLRWLLRSKAGNLKKFIFSVFSVQARKPRKAFTSRPVWPMPLPPAVATSQVSKCKEKALLAIILVLNWLHLGSPSRVPEDYIPYAVMTGEQRGVLHRLNRLCECWDPLMQVSAADMGRTAGKIENLQDAIKELTSAAAALQQQQGYGDAGSKTRKQSSAQSEPSRSMFSEVQLAKDIEAHRITFGGVPSFNPSELLNEETRKIYDQPLKHSTAPEDSHAAPPRAYVRGSRKEVLKLLHKLDSSGRLAIFSPTQVRLRHRAGLFSLIKNQEQDRLILDSRGANSLEEGLNQWTQTMASPIPMLDIVLRPQEHLEASGEDLRDYYYLYAVSLERAARNAIAINLSPAEARRFKCFVESEDDCSFYVPALRTLAMGDINAVEVGQQSHMVLALKSGFKMSDFVTMHGKCPRQSWFAGIIIDDFILVEKVCDSSASERVSEPLADLMVSAYVDHGLKPHEKKRFRSEVDTKFWGAQIAGQRGLIRAQLERSIPVAHITSRLCRLGAGSRKLLEIIAGSWISILQYRRRGMCLLSVIFDVIQEHEYGEAFLLPAALVDELWTLVILAPVFCTDLRAQPDEELSLVDASNSHRAEVAASIPVKLAEELIRHKLTKAAWSRLLSPYRAWLRVHGRLPPEEEVPPGELPSQAHPVWTQLCRSLQFSIRSRKAVKQKTHINISELRAALECEARKGRSKPCSRPLIGSDSQVSLGALVKGRSSSKSLNNLLKRFLPTVLGYSIFSCWQYVGTRDNVSDDPTRYAECRLPSEDLPDWFQSAADGDFSAFDAFLEEEGLDDSSMARLPELHAVVQSLPETSSWRQLRRRAWRASRAKRTRVEKTVLIKPPVATPSRRPTPWLSDRMLGATAVELLRSVPASQFVIPLGRRLDELLSMPGHLDLFSGCRIAAQKLADRSGRWVLCYDLKHSPAEDLLDAGVQQFL